MHLTGFNWVAPTLSLNSKLQSFQTTYNMQLKTMTTTRRMIWLWLET